MAVPLVPSKPLAPIPRYRKIPALDAEILLALPATTLRQPRLRLVALDSLIRQIVHICCPMKKPRQFVLYDEAGGAWVLIRPTSKALALILDFPIFQGYRIRTLSVSEIV